MKLKKQIKYLKEKYNFKEVSSLFFEYKTKKNISFELWNLSIDIMVNANLIIPNFFEFAKKIENEFLKGNLTFPIGGFHIGIKNEFKLNIPTIKASEKLPNGFSSEDMELLKFLFEEVERLVSKKYILKICNNFFVIKHENKTKVIFDIDNL
ncbi:MAG: hypothetical protein K4H23_02495 [Mollicutes bacterium PWAP]|nr:hypothetical protein [Mollicutes bacterium PWAP]